MKKTLLACALCGAMGGAFAADVQVYGLIDTSLSYVHQSADHNGVRSDSLTMENARVFGSRFGLRGSEDLGNGYKIAYVLESGFESDTGAFDKSSGLFTRESHLTLSGDFGALTAGLIPIYGSTLGANGLFRAIDPVGGNYTQGVGSGLVTASRMTRTANALAYRSPTVAGFTGYAMYSFKATSAGEENKSSAERYGSLAARYQAGALEAILVADTTNYAHEAGNADHSDGYTVTFGGNYTFNNQVKVLAFAQYANDSKFLGRTGVSDLGMKEFGVTYGYLDGWAYSIGMNHPLAGGTIKAAIQHRDMKNDEGTTFNRWTLATAYDYPLSKRTVAYFIGGYSQEKIETAKASRTPNGYELTAGIVHRF